MSSLPKVLKNIDPAVLDFLLLRGRGSGSRSGLQQQRDIELGVVFDHPDDFGADNRINSVLRIAELFERQNRIFRLMAHFA